MTTEPEIPANQRSPASTDFPSGPGIGERLPEIDLQDQSGEWVNLEQARGDHRALVVFHRSLRW
jgi:hypothetical protein